MRATPAWRVRSTPGRAAASRRALTLDSEHEDGLAGMGETLLRFGQVEHAKKNFRRILELGYQDDVELMLQVGRALFRDNLVEDAAQFFDIAVQQEPGSAEAVSCMGYAQHRSGEDDAAISTLRRALKLDPDYVEARIYLANLLYDKQEYEAALYQFEKSSPEDHWDELGIWRLIELKKAAYRLQDDDPDLAPWQAQLEELNSGSDSIDEMLSEIEARVMGEGRGRQRLEGPAGAVRHAAGRDARPEGDGAGAQRAHAHRGHLRRELG